MDSTISSFIYTVNVNPCRYVEWIFSIFLVDTSFISCSMFHRNTKLNDEQIRIEDSYAYFICFIRVLDTCIGHTISRSNIQLRNEREGKRFDSLVTLFRYVGLWNIAASPSLMDVSKNTNVQFHDARSDSGYLLPSLLLEFLRRR